MGAVVGDRLGQREVRFEDTLILILAMDHRARRSALHDRNSQRFPVGSWGEQHTDNTQKHDDNRRINELPPVVSRLDEERSRCSKRHRQHGPAGRTNKLNASEERREPTRGIPDAPPREPSEGEASANELDDRP